jgi:hypothetical protein
MSDAPTQRLDSPGAPEPSSGGTPGKRNRGLLVALIVVGALLLVAIIVIALILAFGGGTPTALPSGSPTPTTSTPASTPSATPVPTPTATTGTGGGSSGGGGGGGGDDGTVKVTSYSISPTQVDCSGGKTDVPIAIRWASRNGTAAYFGVNAGGDPQHPGDAKASGMGWTLPASGSDADFPDGYHPYTYPCGNATTNYTITVEGASGTQSRLIVVSRKN